MILCQTDQMHVFKMIFQKHYRTLHEEQKGLPISNTSLQAQKLSTDYMCVREKGGCSKCLQRHFGKHIITHTPQTQTERDERNSFIGICRGLPVIAVTFISTPTCSCNLSSVKNLCIKPQRVR